MPESKKSMVYLTLGSHLDLNWMAPPRDCLDRGCDIINRALDLCQAHEDYCYFIETTVFVEYFLWRFPEKKQLLEQLMDEGRIEISGCFIDHFEHCYDGESIARQYIYGQKYLEKTFGRRYHGVCHSDLPGMSVQIPQICKLAGVDYYIRARGPMGMFAWAAQDGTQMLYACVGYTYSRAEDWRVTRELWHAAGDKDGASLPVYLMRGGFSDLEMPDAQILDALPRLRQEHPQTDFAVASPLKAVKPYLAHMDSLPVISGEWPFGWGSATSLFVRHFLESAEIENDLLTLEKLEAVCFLTGDEVHPSGARAEWMTVLGRFKGDVQPPMLEPGRELYEAWKAELFTQDHNHGGFGGEKTMSDRRIIREELMRFIATFKASALENLFGKIDTLATGSGEAPLFFVPVFNPLAWERDSFVSIPASKLAGKRFSLVTANGETVQAVFEDGELRFTAHSLPALGYKVYYITAATPAPSTLWYTTEETDETLSLETRRFRVTADKRTGTIPVLFDKTLGIQFAGSCEASRFLEIISHEEGTPPDDGVFQRGKARDSEGRVRVCLADANELSVSIIVMTELFKCPITKKITLYRDLNTISLDVSFPWWGKTNRSMRLCLPFTHDRFNQTRYGVPFGSMRWPDMMIGVDDSVVLTAYKFNPDEVGEFERRHVREVQKWLDVGYVDCGMAIGTTASNFFIDESYIEAILLKTLTDCNEGHLPLLNQGEHHWRFTLAPHSGDWTHGAVRAGLEHAVPAQAAIRTPQKGSMPGDGLSFVSTANEQIVVSALKRAYDGSRAVILRFYETAGVSCEAAFHFPFPITNCQKCDLLEDAKETVSFSGNECTLPVRAFEIVTLKILFE